VSYSLNLNSAAFSSNIQALVRSAYSDASPLSGSRIIINLVFSTLLVGNVCFVNGEVYGSSGSIS
jgi:hypothetical protein